MLITTISIGLLHNIYFIPRGLELKHVMFDIDGTLIESYDLDTKLFSESVYDVTGISIDTNWGRYRNVTDSGILEEFFETNRIIASKVETENEIKRIFLKKLKRHVEIQPIREIVGAKDFLVMLQSMSNIQVSIATGGWYESAILKLSSATIDVGSIPIASSNDHVSRIEIMRLAARKGTSRDTSSYTYFGDGPWDKAACELLGFNFVLVGNRISHNQCITCFKSQGEALSYIGL